MFGRRRSPVTKDPSTSSEPVDLVNLNDDVTSSHGASSSQILSVTHPNESAYSRSIMKLSTQEREMLKDSANVGEVISTLERIRHKQLVESKYERSRLALAPWLGPIKTAFGLAGGLLTAEPVAATALSLIQGTIGFVITFFEVADKLDDKIEHFCRLASILTQYDTAGASKNPAINEVS